MVTTFAGSGAQGNTDGSGTAATFNCPWGVAVDAGGNVYVADSHNHTIRKISPSGVVITLAGTQFSSGAADGSSITAQFNYPSGVAVDTAGNVFVADTNNHKIRRISLAGVVTTLAGTEVEGGTNGSGAAASFANPYGVAVDAGGNIYVADTQNHKIRKGIPPLAQSIFFPAINTRAYGDIPFLVSAGTSSGLPVSFSIISGPATISGNTITLTGVGSIVVRATQIGNTTYAAAMVDQSFAVTKGNQTINFSALESKTYGDAPFSVSGSASSGLPVSFSIASGPATIVGSTVTLTNPGTVMVRASQTGNSNYEASSPVDQSFTVQKTFQAINFIPLAGKAYGDSPFPVQAQASSGLPVTFSIVNGPATVSDSMVTLTMPGTVLVRASQAGNAIYAAATSMDQSFIVSKGTQTINFSALLGKTFGEGPFPLSASATSGLAVSFSIVSGPAYVSFK